MIKSGKSLAFASLISLASPALANEGLSTHMFDNQFTGSMDARDAARKALLPLIGSKTIDALGYDSSEMRKQIREITSLPVSDRVNLLLTPTGVSFRSTDESVRLDLKKDAISLKYILPIK